MRFTNQFTNQMTRGLGFKNRPFSLRTNSHQRHLNREYRLVMSVVYSRCFFASWHNHAELCRVHKDTPDLFLRRIDCYNTFQLHCLPPTKKKPPPFPLTS